MDSIDKLMDRIQALEYTKDLLQHEIEKLKQEIKKLQNNEARVVGIYKDVEHL